MPRLSLGLGVQTIRKVGGSPIPQTDLALWLKADAGVSTTPEQFISQIVLSDAGTPEVDGTYTRASGGETGFSSSNGLSLDYIDIVDGSLRFEVFFEGDPMYSIDILYDEIVQISILDGVSPAPTASITLSPTGNTLVTAWTDQSGSANNATAIQFPTYSASAINSKPALVFANNAYLTTSNIFNGSNPRTMFAVYYIDSENYSNTVIGQSNEDSTDMGTYFMLQSRVDQDSSPYLAGYGDDLLGPSYVNQQLLLGMADYDGTTARLFKNGTQANSEAKTYNTHNGAFHIGAFNEAGSIMEKFGGKIAEIVVYNRVLTTQERQQVEAYLNTKYAIY